MFKKPTIRQARKIRNALLIAGSAIAILGRNWGIVFGIGIFLVLSAIIPDLLWNCCPHCGKNLGRNVGDYCQFCGKSLDEES